MKPTPMSPRKALEIHTRRLAEIQAALLEKVRYLADETAAMRREAEKGQIINLAVNPAMRAIDVATLQGELRAAGEALQLLKAMQAGE